MRGLPEQDLLLALLALAIVVVCSRAAGALARRLRQADVLGQLFAGFMLGPSVLGALLPSVYHALFLTGPVSLVLSGFSWIGAVLLLLIAGIEVDVSILRAEARPGALAALGAILPSLVAGAAFAGLALHRQGADAVFLGIVLSVTGVSVAARLLAEREAMRRDYAQVIVAAGVASEALVWVFVSVAASLHHGSPLLAGLRSLVYAVAFVALMLSVGRRFAFWAMRRVADVPGIVQGQLSLVLALTFLAAALTQALGLHVLLGAFVVGVLLSRAPRADRPFQEGLQALTTGLFAPIFFVLAGMRVDIFALGGPSALGPILLLLVVATLVKVGFGALGARLGGLPGWEAALVGVGLNLKGGTDVIVAIIGAELGLLSGRAYTMYAVVAMFTVLASPALLAALAAKAPPGPDEAARLAREEARRRAPRAERVLAPLLPELLPEAAARVVSLIAAAKRQEREIFDITQLAVTGAARPDPRDAPAIARAEESLGAAGRLADVELVQRRADAPDALPAILDAAMGHDLIAIGARPPTPAAELSLGELQDRIVDAAEAPVLVVVAGQEQEPHAIERILVPINGLTPSLEAGDVAAYLAKACRAELVLFNVQHAARATSAGRDGRAVRDAGERALREARFRVERLGVRIDTRVDLADDPGDAIVRELRRRPYQLVALGAVDRGADGRLDLGASIQTVLTQGATPALLLVSHT